MLSPGSYAAVPIRPLTTAKPFSIIMLQQVGRHPYPVNICFWRKVLTMDRLGPTLTVTLHAVTAAHKRELCEPGTLTDP